MPASEGMRDGGDRAGTGRGQGGGGEGCSELKRYRVKVLKSYRVTELQSYRVTELQSYTGSPVPRQRYRFQKNGNFSSPVCVCWRKCIHESRMVACA